MFERISFGFTGFSSVSWMRKGGGREGAVDAEQKKGEYKQKKKKKERKKKGEEQNQNGVHSTTRQRAQNKEAPFIIPFGVFHFWWSTL